MRKKKITALIAAAVILAGITAAALTSLAAPYTAPALTQSQETANVVILCQFTPEQALYEEAVEVSGKQIMRSDFETQEEYEDALSNREQDLYYELAEQERSRRKALCKEIAAGLGLSADDVTYEGTFPETVPLMLCSLTPEQIAAAERNEKILALSDLSLGDWHTAPVYEPVQLSDEDYQKYKVRLQFREFDQSVLESAADAKIADLENAIAPELLDSYEMERCISKYRDLCLREMYSIVRREVTDAAVAALGLSDDEIISRSDAALLIETEMTKTNIAIVQNSSFVKNAFWQENESEMTTSDLPLNYPTYLICYEPVDQAPLEKEAAARAGEYADSLTDLSADEIEKMTAEYYSSVLRELKKSAYASRAESILTELGVEKYKATYSRLAPMIVCQLDPAQYKRAESCSLVTSVEITEEPEEGAPGLDTDTEVSVLRGDANCDFRCDLNDEVAILQFLALPGKYPLTEQGRANADCDGVEGISGGDGLWISLKDAGLV